jgi:hypothetical protein
VTVGAVSLNSAMLLRVVAEFVSTLGTESAQEDRLSTMLAPLLAGQDEGGSVVSGGDVDGVAVRASLQPEPEPEREREPGELRYAGGGGGGGGGRSTPSGVRCAEPEPEPEREGEGAPSGVAGADARSEEEAAARASLAAIIGGSE